MATPEALGAYSEACIDAFDMLDLSQELLQRIRDARSEAISRPFVPIGEIALGGADLMVYAGVKDRGFSSVKRVAEEMHLGDLLLAHKPELVDALPTFTLPIQERNRDSGILTEDFTQAGQARLDEDRKHFSLLGRIHRSELPEGLYRDVFDALSGRVYGEVFNHMMGWVGHREVLVDFNDVAHPSTAELEAYSGIARELLVKV